MTKAECMKKYSPIFIVSIIVAMVGGVYYATKEDTPKISNNDGFLQQAQYEIVLTYELDGRYYIQGLEFLNYTHLLMSTGLEGISAMHLMNITDENGQHTKVMKMIIKTPNQGEYFGEGCTRFGDLVYQLTYKDQKVVIYYLDGLVVKEEIDLPKEIGEGWGITHDDEFLYVTNGSQSIFQVLPSNFTIVKEIRVTKGPSGRNYTTQRYNELEMVGNKHIYANDWKTNDIYKIDKVSGDVIKIWDLTDLYLIQKARIAKESQENQLSYEWTRNVLNGIAYRQESNTFFITGKRWDYMWELTLNQK